MEDDQSDLTMSEIPPENQQPHLPILYEKTLRNNSPIEPHLTAFNNAHDLLATTTTSTNSVTVYRLNGQEAFSVTHPQDPDDETPATAIRWKPDGSLLGVGWADGWCVVYSGEGGKVVGRHLTARRGEDVGGWGLDLEGVEVLEDEEGEAGKCACLGWVRYPGSGSVQENGQDRVDGEEMTTEEWFDGAEEGDLDGSKGTVLEMVRPRISQLANSIATLDVTKPLPPLSAIPAHGLRQLPDGNRFGSQAGVDSIFETRKPASDGIDVLVTSGNSGFTNVLINDSVNIGNVDFKSSCTLSASHPKCSSHVLLSEEDGNQGHHLNYVDLPLDVLGGPLLHVIATNTKRLQNLMSYITQTIRCIRHDYTQGISFPSRLLDRLKDELDPAIEGDTTTNLYHLAMTSSFSPKVHEWLTDIVKDTNHKRWDQAVTTMYTNIQNHVFINLLPALDRMSIATSTLRGHARLHEDTTKFDVASDLFTALLEQVDALRLIARRMQTTVMTELRQFRAFSKWLRVMIEVGVAGPGTKSAMETEEREVPGLDYGMLLPYIKSTITHSGLDVHIAALAGLKGSCSKTDFFNHEAMSRISRSNTLAALEAAEKNPSPYDLNAAAITARIAAQVRLCLKAVTNWQGKMLPAPTTLPLPLQQEKIHDIRMHPEAGEQGTTTEILTSSQNNTLDIYRLTRYTDDNTSSTTTQTFPVDQSEVKHAQFLTRKTVLLTSNHHLIAWSTSTTSKEEKRILHTFPPHFTPRHFVLGGRKGKMVAVVFEERGTGWIVLDLEEGDGGSLG